ncbi:hypothetical protein [Herbidospora sp. NBRC 101105]|uniref:hypothetical protein n=1 Tax=Herbidospora sp. NBRC 101105 TaxID=3032195 RepID=UPI0024A3582B|nr:hypothetical protein [Herbidospora sp. NBRC 101105]GLX97020.1 hypothetical protein Hesp01_49700 [Herbidospora sp. NBRC 101105]
MTITFRRALLALAVLPIAACSSPAETAAPAPTVTATVTETVTPPAPQPTETVAEPTESAAPAQTPQVSADVDKEDPISARIPKIKSAKFQYDEGHDFNQMSPSADGVLRGRIVSLDGDEARYVPVRYAGGDFVGPEGGMTYAAPIASDVVFLSAVGCKGDDQTINSAALGTEKCPRERLLELAAQGEPTSLITVKSGQIVKVVEIYY